LRSVSDSEECKKENVFKNDEYIVKIPENAIKQDLLTLKEFLKLEKS